MVGERVLLAGEDIIEEFLHLLAYSSPHAFSALLLFLPSRVIERVKTVVGRMVVEERAHEEVEVKACLQLIPVGGSRLAEVLLVEDEDSTIETAVGVVSVGD